MDKNRRKIIIIIMILGILILMIGITYALYNYSKLGSNQQLLAGDIYMNFKETNEISMSNVIPTQTYSEDNCFEFQILGKNTYAKKDIWYEIVLSHGKDHDTRTTRIKDRLLKFTLIEKEGDKETVIFDGRSYYEINNTKIWVNTIKANTLSEINKTYKLYVWIDYQTVIGNVDYADYDLDTWENDVYASVKVSVNGDFNEKTITEFSAEEIAKNVVTYIGASSNDFSGGLVAINGTEGNDYGLLYNENNAEHTIREYRYIGENVDNYIYYNCSDTANGYNYGELDYDYETNCERWRIVGIFKSDGEEYLKIMNNNVISNIPNTYNYNNTTYTLNEENFNGTYIYYNKPAKSPATNYNDWTEAGLQYYLNTEHDNSQTPISGYLSSLTNTAKNLIRETKFYLGNVYYNTTAKQSYIDERGNEMCTSPILNSHENDCNIWKNNKDNWIGNVALLYPSDYGYSVNPTYWDDITLLNYDSNDVKSTTWMMQIPNRGVAEWFISPSSTGEDRGSNLLNTGKVLEDFVSYSYSNGNEVRPVVNLKASTKILKGNGTINSPYVVII